MQLRTLVLLLLCCSACHRTGAEEARIAFDEAKWKTKDDQDYPYRNAMLDDLIENQTLKGLKKDELTDLLGPPDRVDSLYLFYLVTQKRIYFFPLHTKTLVFKLTSDSTVEWRKIHQ